MKSIFEARAQYKSLGAADQAIIKNKKFSGEFPADQWLNFVDRITTYDRATERGRSSACGFFWGSIFAAILAFMLASILVQIWPLILSGILLIIGFAFFLPAWLTFRSTDFPDTLRTYVAPLIAILREDLKPDSTLKCSIDFTPCDAASKQVDSQTVPSEQLPPRTLRRTNTRFTNPWLSIEGSLVDGSKLKFAITDYGAKAKVMKRSRSGKTKHKQKCKVKRLSRVTLRPSSDYNVTSVPPPVPGAPPSVPGTPITEVTTRPDGSIALRSQQMQPLPISHSFDEMPTPKVDTFIELTDHALKLLSRK